jgi:hypothetical protein
MVGRGSLSEYDRDLPLVQFLFSCKYDSVPAYLTTILPPIAKKELAPPPSREMRLALLWRQA